MARGSRKLARCVRFGFAAPLPFAVLVALARCGTDAVGVASCQQIEEARCRRATGCGIALDPPHRTSGTDVSACIRFYDTACLHGLAVGDPGSAAVGACIAAIESDPTCATVVSPETNPACAWLAAPSTAAADAAVAADAGDAGE